MNSIVRRLRGFTFFPEPSPTPLWADVTRFCRQRERERERERNIEGKQQKERVRERERGDVFRERERARNIEGKQQKERVRERGEMYSERERERERDVFRERERERERDVFRERERCIQEEREWDRVEGPLCIIKGRNARRPWEQKKRERKKNWLKTWTRKRNTVFCW